MKSRAELESLLKAAQEKVQTKRHDLNNAIQAQKMIEDLLETAYGVKPEVSALSQPWHCNDCKQMIPPDQYHDCKGGTLP